MNNQEKDQGLSMDLLVGQLGTSADVTQLREKVSEIGNSESKVSAALPKIQRERIERKVAYEDSKQNINKWNRIVFGNRQKETIQFDEATPDHLKITSESLAASFKPMNSMEKEIQVILEKSEMKEKSIQDRENADLKMNKLSVEEVQKRNSDLSYMKSLLFYQEQKNKRVNKIKSKKFRKIHKRAEEKRKEKEREMLRETDPELYQELVEKDAVKRAQERMTLKHKNTSKWVKRALQHGGMSDQNTREAINEQLREGEKLKRRMEGKRKDSESESSSDDEKETTKDQLIEEAASVLRDIDRDMLDKHKGVFQMEFMKRALQKQKEEAKKEAEKLMEALQDEEEFNEEEKKSEGEGNEEESNDEALEKRVTESLTTGKRNKKGVKSLEVKDNISLSDSLFKIPALPSMFENEEKKNVSSRLLEEMSEDEEVKPPSETKYDDSANPWLNNEESVSHDKSRKSVSKSAEVVDMKAAVSKIEEIAPEPKCVIIDEKSVKEKQNKVVSGELGFDEELTQEKLMARAFDEEGDKEFDSMKRKQEERDVTDYKKEHGIKDEVVLEGWGSWAGIGAPEPKKRKIEKPIEVEAPKRKDAHLKHVIINQKVDKKAQQYKVEGIPFPYTSREQYERVMRQPIGREWNSAKSYHDLTRPEIKTRLGTIIEPIKMPEKKNHRKF